ncbi:carboxymuconolactone decarboxylase family protein [Candidatus Nitrotoga arctica]|uniref:4-carboxymuconolactone decarboxylase n=1 Tax=Candidatus Nitrotoga arctica TaxID=453162 RepID=A0ABN8AMP6_9PROT|nr:carboxymuconolactone decarboxylase family protein [Candidatus Nitrotoga arctica]CAG9932909.1 putative 4-carboxymuconolactone decarboxylase [Candidatus Nitrotoga arctica]
MQTRKLGGLEVSELGFGCMSISGNYGPPADRKTHLFGDIFDRDNLDWPSRELATVGMLSALQGAESQLQAHMRISMNVGITAD